MARTVEEREKLMNCAYNRGKHYLSMLIEHPWSKRAWMEVRMSACILAECNRSHSDKRTQEMQAIVWKYAWYRKEASLEKWQNSGYFDEKFYQKAIDK